MGLAASAVLVVAGATGALLLLPWRPPLFSRLHVNLALGPFGNRLVVAATVVSILLILGGQVLWWRSRILRVTRGRGWRRVLHDLHHAAGFVGAVVMLLLAASGIWLMFTPGGPKSPPEVREKRRMVHGLHTARPYSLPVKAVYFAGSMLFVLQGVSGFTMWWKPRRRAAGAPARPPAG
jgi:uncharacterized iron-regulated membrane protein